MVERTVSGTTSADDQHDRQLTLSPQTAAIINLETIKNVQPKQNHVLILSTLTPQGDLM